jgi:uncharacterized protein
MNRRTFFKAAAAGVVTSATATACAGCAEASEFVVERPEVAVANLPVSFDGLRVAFLTDLHHGPYTALPYIVDCVRATLALQPDLIVLGGDYCLREAKFIRPVFEVLGELHAPLGVYGVLGNHDYAHGISETLAGMRAAGIVELTNRGAWVRRDGEKLRLAGVDDLWRGLPDAAAAFGDATLADACVLVSHNPDFAETLRDRRAGLVLSGHTHGGQVFVPGMRNPFIPSRYGEKYRRGFVDAPATRVYVSRGLGSTGLPVRYNCPPELTLLTLRCAG